MSYLKKFPEIEEEVIKCMKCGNCQAVCPLYKETKAEAMVARGKVRLAEGILSGEIQPTDELTAVFDKCLTCKACAANCPCGVQPDKIVLAARSELVKKRGLPLAKNLIFKCLSNPSLFKTGMKIGSKTQGLFFKRQGNKMSPRYPVSGLELRRVIPALADKSFLATVPEVNKVAKAKKKVAFFSGCTANFVYPKVGYSLLEVMKHNDVEVIVPKEQHCCGVPVLMHGDTKTAVEMAKSHVNIFSKYEVDAIITVCGTCGEAFKKYYPELLSDLPGYGENAKMLSEKTYDFTQYLINQLGLETEKLGPVNKTVTYHQPCHVGRGMGAVTEPIEIIKAIPGIKFNPLKQPDRCCGGAGSFSLTHYNLSYNILESKLADIESSAADTVVTGCGSCRMQLTDGLTQEKMTQSVMHTVELLAESYRNGSEKRG
ncbi:(Fe-S)-binding protein [Desulfofalx alkaliphila]|uniref:(Fe-S)-binding protein n=1 Tax=Desulfofalx alkaliphila TaxID=105483 RepID=UPI0004E1AA01|nr:(Fe-S)-binding protein [Desulfofalx alkaliphila]